MYHFRDVTLSFTMSKWHTYEYPIARLPPFGRVGVGSPSLNREGWGGSVGLSFNPSPQPPVIKQVTLHGEVFYLLQHLYNTTSAHTEMYHHSLLRTFIAQIIWPFGNMFVLLSATTH